MNNKPILWLTSKWPLPPNDGSRRATFNLLKGLSNLGTEIVLCSYLQPEDSINIEEAKSLLALKDVVIINPNTNSNTNKISVTGSKIASLLSRPLLPLTMNKFARTGFAPDLKNFGAILYDGLHTAAHWQTYGLYSPPKNASVPIIYRAHNRESLIWERKCQLANVFLKPLFKWQSCLVKRFEDSLAKHCNLVATVSDNDAKLFHNLSSNQLITVPIGYEFNALSPAKGVDNILYVGRLDWPPNREGLEWFLSNVWPEVKRRQPNKILTIIGSGNSSWMRNYSQVSGIEFLGKVADLKEHYRRCAVAIVPIFFGGGTRVKAIEAASFARAVVSTEIGIEGLPLSKNSSYFFGDNAKEWISILSELSPEKCTAVGQKAFSSLKDTFSIDGAAHILNEASKKIELVR
jgi:hypothetical protein